MYSQEKNNNQMIEMSKSWHFELRVSGLLVACMVAFNSTLLKEHHLTVEIQFKTAIRLKIVTSIKTTKQQLLLIENVKIYHLNSLQSYVHWDDFPIASINRFDVSIWIALHNCWMNNPQLQLHSHQSCVFCWINANHVPTIFFLLPNRVNILLISPNASSRWNCCSFFCFGYNKCAGWKKICVTK